ncbi:hypothetical protein FHS14_003765 [Paenibacillus baekrokdamisoli]|nr:hypothetical protein [Paenibacillus baekrokdamisoli]MBB3070763.1 hypothetical protein [Paenibacillus baekrokdamisoli]
METLMKQAYAAPPIRANILNKGMISLYCDYSGYAEQNAHGVACCFVYNRTISVTSKKLNPKYDGGSDYGELLAIVFSLELLTKALMEHQLNSIPKFATIFTDCHCIAKILSKEYFDKQFYEDVRNEILASLDDLQNMFPEIQVKVKYISKHKKNNALHRMAHNAARKAIGK